MLTESRRAPALPPLSLADCRSILRSLTENAAIGISLAAPDGQIAFVNPAFADMLGYAPEECLGFFAHDLAPPDAADAARAQMQDMRDGNADSYRAERHYRRKDGSNFWGRVTGSIARDDTGKLLYFIFQLENIDGQRAAETALEENEKRWNYALEAAGQGVWDHDFRNGRMFYSRMWKRIRGLDPDADVEIAIADWEDRVHPDDKDRVLAEVRRHDKGEVPSFALEYRERRHDGAWIWILSRGRAVEWLPDGTPARVVGTDTDITSLKEEEARKATEALAAYRENLARIEKAHQAAEQAQQLALSLARHDALTGLPNRRVFAEVLAKAIARTGRGGGGNAVLIIDLDRFKPVNDIHGHAAGDTVLCEIARRLRTIARGGDTIARLGGDEFAVVVETARPDEDPGDAAVRFAQRAIEAIQEPVIVDERPVEVGASIGISLCPTDGSDPEILLRAADIAMYRAKQDGRGTFRFFQASMEAELRTRADLEDDVREAVLNEDIEPHYQPLMQLAENRLTGFEILARWRHPKRGDVPPDVFIPVVEQLGLIADLTYSLLRRACRDALNWPAELTIALNVSPFHLADALLPVRLLAILSETGFPPKRLEVEITETAIARDIDTARTALATLKDLGIKISLDDFGTGYSSLYHLRELHFDKIKIDRSFVQSMGSDVSKAHLVRSILDLARNLGMPTIAEGIEQVETLRQIMAGGGEYGQGFYFGKAMPAGDVDRLVAASAEKQAAG